MYCTGDLLRLLIHGLASIFEVGALHTPTETGLIKLLTFLDKGKGLFQPFYIVMYTRV